MQTTKTKHLYRKYKQLLQRLKRQMQNGRFSAFTIQKQHALLARLQRYARRLAIPVTGILLGGLPLTGFAQTPMGEEFKVNAFSGGEQNNSDLAASADGKNVIVYESEDLDGDGTGIYFKLYDENGTQIGVETRVNDFITNDQTEPAVAMDSDGDFVVAWTSYAQYGSTKNIYVRQFNKDGTPKANEFRINNYVLNNQGKASVAVDNDGDFVVVWESVGQDGDGTAVIGQLVSADGVQVGSELQINSYATANQRRPSVAMDANGDFVVVWFSGTFTGTGQDGSGYGIYGQRYSLDGIKQGGEFRVNAYTPYNQSFPSVSMDADGDFAVVWQSGFISGATPDGSSYGIYIRRYLSDGAPQGSESLVNTTTTGSQSSPDLAMNTDGDFVVVWQGPEPIASINGEIYAQRYFADGTPVAGEFLVNTYTTNPQVAPSVAMDESCEFIIAWTSDKQDGSDFGVYAQRYFIGTGEEFRVNTFTINSQGQGSVAMDADGDFVVVWRSYFQDGDESGIYGQRYSSDGTKQGGEFQVNTYTNSSQRLPSVAMDVDGDFVVIWESRYQDGNSGGIYGQRYSSDGSANGSEFRVNTETYSSQFNPSVAIDSDGDFVVVWSSSGQDGSSSGVYAQRYNSDGSTNGPEFPVNTETNSSQFNPSIAMDTDGDFVVVWQSFGQDDSSEGIYAQRYNSDGSTNGPEFPVNTETYSSQSNPSVAIDSDGDFVVVWSSSGQDGSSSGVYAQRYNSDGSTNGSEFQVNTETYEGQSNPSVAIDTDGDFVVVWESRDQDGSVRGVYAQRYNSDGSTNGSEFQVNTETYDYQFNPSVAVDTDGDFVVVWTSYGQDGSDGGIYAQRYQGKTSESACSSDPLTLSGMETGVIDYLSQADITSTQLIQNNAEVLYQSATMIELKMGFHAEIGSIFTARIEDCTAASIVGKPSEIVARSERPMLQSQRSNNQLQVFPNPTNGVLQFALPLDTKVQSIVLYDQLGKRLKQVPIEERKLSLEELVSGIYLLILNFCKAKNSE